MKNCLHLEFSAAVSVGRITSDTNPNEIVRFTVEIVAKCAVCGADLEFQGLPIGIDTHGPTVSPDGLEARLVAQIAGTKFIHRNRTAAIFRDFGGNA